MIIENNVNNGKSMLPTTGKEMARRGWDRPDIILVTGDAYVDHPSFGVALIGRWLEKHGYRVAILAQPDWRSAEPFRHFGPPRLFWGITSGAVDSRLNAYHSMGHHRKWDAYSPGGKTGWRAKQPLLAYSSRVRQAHKKKVPVILGGIEASLRRLVHYDFIEDQLKRSMLIDAKADLLVFGMAERTILEIARRLDGGEAIENITDLAGTAWPVMQGRTVPDSAVEIPSLEQQQADPEQVMKAHLDYQHQCHPKGRAVVQDQNPGRIVILPPAEPLSTAEMDAVYALPFTRRWHRRYDKEGGVPALESIRFSITTHRGCFGGCSFCSLYFHQGKQISSRSVESIVAEADACKAHDAFRGTISDIGGPTANMYGMSCSQGWTCSRTSCLFPKICPHLNVSAEPLMKMMKAMLQWRNRCGSSTHVFVASGVRHDLALHMPDYLELLAREFVGGHLKIAPEHCSNSVLQLMGKTPFGLFEQFQDRFRALSREADKEQYLVPYFISAHPGSTIADAIELMEYLVHRGWQVRQVQDFTPIPLTLSTAMFVSGLDGQGRSIHVPRGRREKQQQMALLKYYESRYEKVVLPLLKSHGRMDLATLIKKSKRPGPDGKQHRRPADRSDDYE